MELRLSQRKQVWDIIEHVVKKMPIPNALMDDAQVVHRLLSLSVEQPQFICDWLRLVPISGWSHLTERDILPEEQMVDLHLAVGFSEYNMVDWLRGLSNGGVSFFHQYATKKMVKGVDQWVFKSRYNPRLLDGVYLNDMPTEMNALPRILDQVLKKRIPIKQYHQVLGQFNPTPDIALQAVEMLIEKHQAFSSIVSSDDVLVFRVACGLFDFLPNAQPYMLRVGHVVEQLISSSTLSKSLALLNLLPTVIINHMLQQFIHAPMPIVLEHLNQTLPNFEYGAIRKIVRRSRLGLHYKHD